MKELKPAERKYLVGSKDESRKIVEHLKNQGFQAISSKSPGYKINESIFYIPDTIYLFDERSPEEIHGYFHIDYEPPFKLEVVKGSRLERCIMGFEE